MTGAGDSEGIRVRRRPIIAVALGETVVCGLLLWVAWAVVPSDMGGLTRLMRPFLPVVPVVVLIDSGRYIRGAVVGTIEVNEDGLVVPWFWRRSRRYIPWSTVASAEVGTVVGLGIRTERLRLLGPDGAVRGLVAKRWVQQWDELLDVVRDRCGEIRARPPIGAWDATAADDVVPWLPRRRK